MSSVRIEFLSLLSEFVNIDELEFPIQEYIPIESLIEKITKKYGDEFKNKILDEDGKLRKSILLVVNGNHIESQNERDILIQNGDEVSFIPAIAGG